MIPVGYMAKRAARRPDWLSSAGVEAIYSVSPCLSEDFTDYTTHWKINAYWFLDSPEIIREIAESQGIDLTETALFYYEMYELEFHESEREWRPIKPQPGMSANVVEPPEKRLEGHDVVTFSMGAGPECSPLSCNSLALEIPTNRRCLMSSFEEAKEALEKGLFRRSEPGPYRIFAVYSA